MPGSGSDRYYTPLSLAEEIRLISAAKHGDAASFERLVEVFMPRAVRVAQGYTGNREDAIDMAQESFYKVYKHLDRFRDGEPFTNWFFRILRNTCFNFIARRKTARAISIHPKDEDGFAIDLPDQDTEEAPERIEAGERKTVIWNAIQSLGVKHREILILRHFEELEYAAIAEVLDIPIGTVMSRLFHARKKLAAILEPYIQEGKPVLP